MGYSVRYVNDIQLLLFKQRRACHASLCCMKSCRWFAVIDVFHPISPSTSRVKIALIDLNQNALCRESHCLYKKNDIIDFPITHNS